MKGTLGQRLASDIEAAGYSIRGFAAELQQRRPRKSLESWRATVRRYIRDKDQPGDEIGALMADVLGQPSDSYAKLRRRRETIASLREERDDLLARLAAAEGAESGRGQP